MGQVSLVPGECSPCAQLSQHGVSCQGAARSHSLTLSKLERAIRVREGSEETKAEQDAMWSSVNVRRLILMTERSSS